MEKTETLNADNNTDQQKQVDIHTSCEDKNNISSQKNSGIGKKVIGYIKRSLFLCVGLFIMSFAIALSIKAALGTSPISSTPYVLNIVTGLSVGVTTIIFNTLIVLLQIVILRKKFRPFQLLQIPVSMIFGFLCDFALFCLDGLTLSAYWQQWLVCIASVVVLAFGVSIEVNAKLVTLAGEGLVLAICRICPIKFGYMKVICDLGMVLTAVLISLIFLHNVQGVREGTLAAAVFVGLIAKQFNRFMTPFSQKLLGISEKKQSADLSEGSEKEQDTGTTEN